MFCEKYGVPYTDEIVAIRRRYGISAQKKMSLILGIGINQYLLYKQGEVVWCTKMNKLLFYIDFLSYRENGMAISGLSYKAIDYGPVPERWDVVYSEFDEIHQELRSARDFVGSVLISTDKADMTLFSEAERKVMEQVLERFKSLSSRELSKLSHEEKAWINHHDRHESIPFSEAFDLTAI